MNTDIKVHITDAEHRILAEKMSEIDHGCVGEYSFTRDNMDFELHFFHTNFERPDKVYLDVSDEEGNPLESDFDDRLFYEQLEKVRSGIKEQQTESSETFRRLKATA